jgi:hypothetical protein
MTTVLKVNGDASGTIEHRMLFTTAALAQMRQFATFAGGSGQRFDPVSEEQTRAMAESIGPGVTYVSSTPITTPDGRGRDATYAFTDVGQIRITQQPAAPGGVSLRTQGLSTDAEAITCSLTHEANGNVVLHVHVPEPNIPGATGSGTALPPGQLELIKSMLGGARVAVSVEPNGQLVKTSSPYVDGRRVTLLEVDLDQLLKDETLVDRVQAAKTTDEAKAILKDVPGLKMNFDREITVEFTPAK